eukprot:10719412-Prorocentrum_lima.AAC.1
MTSSLVGSEMCIRDSRWCCGGTIVISAGARRRWRGSWVRPSREDGQGPVSYTHLTLPTICSV